MLFRLLQQPSQASRWGKLRGQTLVVEVRHPVFYLQNQGQGRPVSRILLYPAIHLRGIPGPLAGPRLPARRDVNAPTGQFGLLAPVVYLAGPSGFRLGIPPVGSYPTLSPITCATANRGHRLVCSLLHLT
jgi:hypothetical protein